MKINGLFFGNFWDVLVDVLYYHRFKMKDATN
jgi:hypothetical protein